MAVPPPHHHKKKSRKTEIAKFLIFRTIGNFLILFTLFGFFATFGPALYWELHYQLINVFHIKYTVAQSVGQSSELGKLVDKIEKQNPHAGSSLFDSIVNGEKEKILVPQDPAFSVVVPKIGANERIFPNVDPNNEDQYLRVLLQGVAHSKGSAFPGMGGTTYLFAHSADNFWNVGRYNAVFYLLNKMITGDDIAIFYNNQRYNYVVYDTKIVDAFDTQYMSANLGQGEKLILQTCWPPGTAWKRFLVFAKPISK